MEFRSIAGALADEHKQLCCQVFPPPFFWAIWSAN